MTITDRLNATKAALALAATDSKRDLKDITLICVTKTFSTHEIEPLLEAGHRVFGENRVQEASGKWPSLRASYPNLELHLIGPLQSNKTREAIETFDTIQSLDREKLAYAIAEEISRSKNIQNSSSKLIPGQSHKKRGPSRKRRISLSRFAERPIT